jgi:LuxR family maltose regulon positive regulatory protein
MWLTSMRALMCRDGVERMRSEVDDAGPGLVAAGPAGDQEYPLRLFLSAVAHLLLGDADTAEDRLADVTELTSDGSRLHLFPVVMAYRALLALGRPDLEAAEAFVQQGLTGVRRARGESHVTSLLVFATAARVALHRGDAADARAQLSEAQRLRPLLSHAIPWYAVGALLEMAEVAIGLADPSGARQFVRDAEAVLRRRPDLGVLGSRTEELRRRLTISAAPSGPTSILTSAELRILPLLVTHLTLARIADRLFLSRHTVKSQVWSMYQKLDVHTRGGAVVRARELGLLEA